MEKVKKEREKILRLTTKKTKYHHSIGGQSCGMPKTIIVLENDIGLKLELSCYHSQLKNLDLGMQLMELAIMELIK